MFVDLHIHSHFSDGSATPDEILRMAREHKVSYIAIADHNGLGACDYLAGDPRFADVSRINAVELDVIHQGGVHHILGYGFDPKHPRIREACRHNAAAQEENNNETVRRLARKLDQVNFADYLAYTQPKGRGGWKLLSYLLDLGVTSSLFEGMRYYDEMHTMPYKIRFLSARDAVSAIRESGGIAIIAHPGETIHFGHDSAAFGAILLSFILDGVEGVECYYPSHTSAVEQALVDFCGQHGLFISGGSDYHGTFFRGNKQVIGSQFVKADAVRGLLEELGLRPPAA